MFFTYLDISSLFISSNMFPGSYSADGIKFIIVKAKMY